MPPNYMAKKNSFGRFQESSFVSRSAVRQSASPLYGVLSFCSPKLIDTLIIDSQINFVKGEFQFYWVVNENPGIRRR